MGVAVLPVAGAPASAAPSADVVISAVYGAGGNSGAVLNADYVELFNRGASAVSLGGLSIQYGSATGTGAIGNGPTGGTELPDVSLAPGQHYLVQESSGANGSALPTPDLVDPTPISMSASAGKVALVRGTTSLGCNGGSIPCTPDQLARVVDLLGWGNANFFEGTGPGPGTSASTGDARVDGGCRDTDDNASDFAAGTPAPRTTTSQVTPCGSIVDLPPTVKTTEPSSGSTTLAVNGDLSVTFSEPVTAGAGAFSLSCATSGDHALDVTGGPTTFTLNPLADLAAAEACTLTVRGADVADQDGTTDPMASDFTLSFTTAADVCTISATPIHQIQGAGTASPLADDEVTARGVVVADTPGLSGFFVQDLAPDADPATSEGLFVFVPSANPFSSVDVNVGDVVAVSGTVKEFQGMTELDSVTALRACGTAAVPAPVVYDLPEPANNDLERVEGMLVTVPQTLTVQQNYFEGRYGQVTLGSGGRRYQPTNIYPASSPQAQQLADSNARALIVLDDNSSRQNPDPVPYLGDDGVLRAGDTVSGVTGVVDYGPINSDTSIRDYRIQPTVTPVFTQTNPRTAAPAPVGGDLKVASFNVLNYFTTFTGANARGANNAAEFARQRAKIFAAVSAIDADVVGLLEIENSPDDTAIDNFVAGLNDYVGSARYAKVPAPAPLGDDAIRVAMIYQPARVSLAGPPMTFDVPAFANARVPLAQTFVRAGTDEKVSVIINHFKSKGSCPDPGTDPGNEDRGDGQGCWNASRVAQAGAILDFVDAVQDASGDQDVLVIGDLNSYAEEDPILALEAGGLSDQVERFLDKTAYSYVFDGMSGYLDHALATPSLAAQITGVSEWHINADEPSVIDYNTEFKPDDRYEPTPYRSSDHDPVIVGIQLDDLAGIRAQFDALDSLLTQYASEGKITQGVAASLRDRLTRARALAEEGSETRTIGYLQQFIDRAENQIKGNMDLAARDELVRRAQVLIHDLRFREAAENRSGDAAR
jgi:predicted extracellular nuclease